MTTDCPDPRGMPCPDCPDAATPCHDDSELWQRDPDDPDDQPSTGETYRLRLFLRSKCRDRPDGSPCRAARKRWVNTPASAKDNLIDQLIDELASTTRTIVRSQARSAARRKRLANHERKLANVK